MKYAVLASRLAATVTLEGKHIMMASIKLAGGWLVMCSALVASPASAQQILATAPASLVVAVQSGTSPGNTGASVQSVQTALSRIIANKQIRSFLTPSQPTADELITLTAFLSGEAKVQFFGPATERLVFYLQIQQGLGDSLRGFVDAATAGVLNSLAPVPTLACSIVRVGSGDRKASEPSSVTIEIVDTVGQIVSSRPVFLRLNEQAISRDDSARGSWCRFSLGNITTAFRAAAIYGYAGWPDTLAVPAQ